MINEKRERKIIINQKNMFAIKRDDEILYIYK